MNILAALGLVLELAAGPVIGLDKPLRGATASAAASVAYGPLEGGLRGGLSWDVSLGAFVAGADFSLGMGPELRILVGGELPLGRLSLQSGGSTIGLSPEPWPNRFGLSATIAELGSRPRILVETELSWSAYRMLRAAGEAGTAGAAGLSSTAVSATGVSASQGLAGFAAGCRVTIALRLRWERPGKR